MDLTHASFFSGVGGLDLGLERAGWRTVGFSEIDPYASAVLAERWPGVPNLGDITDLASRPAQQSGGFPEFDCAAGASLWSGGFPCQDLSVAGKRRGLAGERSGLAFAFLDLVGRHRPRFVLLENVLGLLSSHGGRDMAALTGALVELGYGVGYRVLDARYFGVPQRRRRVFILGDSLGGRAGAERAAEVLSVGSRCDRHPPAGGEAGPGAAERARAGVDIARAVTGTSGKRHDDDTDTLIANGLRASDGHHGYSSPRGDGGGGLVVGTSPDPGGVRAPDGLARRLDDRGGVAAYTKAGRAQTADDGETWREGDVMPTLNSFDVGDVRTTAVILGTDQADDPLLPLGLDSHRYRCCGNGVVADVAEWIGLRLAAIA